MAHNLDFGWLGGDTRNGNNTTPLLDSFAIPTMLPSVGIGENISEVLLSLLVRLDKVDIKALALALSRATACLSRIDTSTLTQASYEAQLDRIEAALSGLGQERAEDLDRLGRIEREVHEVANTQSRIESLVGAVSEAVGALREKLADFSKSLYRIVQSSSDDLRLQ
ncbi:hypothetical protein SEUCBS140593_010446 [Sporothrix eucalyptigena]|uniref:Uncharacterized protein n=1 Tax=Sporothrix eucalyptigena TaxID=1812306 RepID=A0ABP0D534_9PEZI